MLATMKRDDPVAALFVQTRLKAQKKVLGLEGWEALIKGGYRDALELAEDRPDLWVPTRDIRVVRNRCVTRNLCAGIVQMLIASAWPTGAIYKYHDSGTGTTAEGLEDTALVTPWGGARSVGTQIIKPDYDYIYRSVATTIYNNTFAITEHGLFCTTSGNTPGGYNLMDRTVFTAVNVVNTDSIIFTYDISFTPGS